MSFKDEVNSVKRTSEQIKSLQLDKIKDAFYKDVEDTIRRFPAGDKFRNLCDLIKSAAHSGNYQNNIIRGESVVCTNIPALSENYIIFSYRKKYFLPEPPNCLLKWFSEVKALCLKEGIVCDLFLKIQYESHGSLPICYYKSIDTIKVTDKSYYCTRLYYVIKYSMKL